MMTKGPPTTCLMLYVDESSVVERLASDTCVIDAAALSTFAVHHVAATTTATKQSKSCFGLAVFSFLLPLESSSLLVTHTMQAPRIGNIQADSR